MADPDVGTQCNITKDSPTGGSLSASVTQQGPLCAASGTSFNVNVPGVTLTGIGLTAWGNCYLYRGTASAQTNKSGVGSLSADFPFLAPTVLSIK